MSVIIVPALCRGRPTCLCEDALQCLAAHMTGVVCAGGHSVVPLVLSEWRALQAWLSHHPSDYTAYHYLHAFVELLTSSHCESCPALRGGSGPRSAAMLALLRPMARQVMYEIDTLYGYYEAK
ncbi:hypothetical protein EV182_003157, partial [Spiromyces aspiralis]